MKLTNQTQRYLASLALKGDINKTLDQKFKHKILGDIRTYENWLLHLLQIEINWDFPGYDFVLEDCLELLEPMEK